MFVWCHYIKNDLKTSTINSFDSSVEKNISDFFDWQGAELLACLCVWILTSVDDITASEATSHLDEGPEHHHWTLHDLSVIWRTLLGRGCVRPLLRGFELFQRVRVIHSHIQYCFHGEGFPRNLLLIYHFCFTTKFRGLILCWCICLRTAPCCWCWGCLSCAANTETSLRPKWTWWTSRRPFSLWGSRNVRRLLLKPSLTHIPADTAEEQ